MAVPDSEEWKKSFLSSPPIAAQSEESAQATSLVKPLLSRYNLPQSTFEQALVFWHARISVQAEDISKRWKKYVLLIQERESILENERAEFENVKQLIKDACKLKNDADARGSLLPKIVKLLEGMANHLSAHEAKFENIDALLEAIQQTQKEHATQFSDFSRAVLKSQKEQTLLLEHIIKTRAIKDPGCDHAHRIKHTSSSKLPVSLAEWDVPDSQDCQHCKTDTTLHASESRLSENYTTNMTGIMEEVLEEEIRTRVVPQEFMHSPASPPNSVRKRPKLTATGRVKLLDSSDEESYGLFQHEMPTCPPLFPLTGEAVLENTNLLGEVDLPRASTRARKRRLLS